MFRLEFYFFLKNNLFRLAEIRQNYQQCSFYRYSTPFLVKFYNYFLQILNKGNAIIFISLTIR